MGLYMIDRMYLDEVLGSSEDGKDSKDRNSKKRKVDAADDDAGLENTRGSKKKSGVGYDGAVKEDVSRQWR